MWWKGKLRKKISEIYLLTPLKAEGQAHNLCEQLPGKTVSRCIYSSIYRTAYSGQKNRISRLLLCKLVQSLTFNL